MAGENIMKFLLLDFNNILFRNIFTHQTTSFAGLYTGGVYGFLTTMCFYVNLHNPDYVIVFSDKYPLKRKALFPSYKANRKAKKGGPIPIPHLIIVSKTNLQKVFELMNVAFVEEEGYESDDLISQFVIDHSDEEIVIASNDEDLMGLLQYNVILQRNKDVFTEEKFVKEFGLPSSMWPTIQLLSGSHNGVKPLYRGLGKKTAINIIKNGDLKKVEKKYKKRWQENYHLTKLPFDDIISVTKVIALDKGFNLRILENFLIHNFGINITNAMDRAFETMRKT
jgi:5'-3' exonuclease